MATTRTGQSHDLREIRRALTVLYHPGDVVELRALGVGGKTVAGYFDDHAKLAEAAAKLSGSAAGVYVVLNEFIPALLARSANRLTTGPKTLTQGLARESVRQCAWARQYFAEQMRLGHKPSRAYRALANRWAAIIWKMLQEREPFNQSRLDKSRVKALSAV